MARLEIVGKPADRVDALEKVLGTAKYVADYKLPDMLYGRALRSELPHGKIKKLDADPALEVPGVVAVVTYEDFVNQGNFGFPISDQYVLAFDKVRHVGEAIAVVAAETREAAKKGVQAIVCEIEELPILSDMDHSLDEDAPQVGPDRDDGKHPNFVDISIVRKDDPAALLDKCDVKLERRYHVPNQEHAYMETEGALAIPTPEGGVVVYASNQSPFINRDILMAVLGLSERRVRVILPPVGGSFGGKDDLNYYASAQTAALALKTRRPVRMTFSRDESLIASYKRDAMNMEVKLGADADGTLRACKFDGILDSGAYASQSPFTGWRAAIHAMGSYRYDACHVDITGVYTNNSYCGAFRGFGNPEVCFAIEQTVDEMAEACSMDPIDFRLKNCLRVGDVTPHGQKLNESVGLSDCLAKVRQASGWDRKRKEYPQQNEKTDIKKGLGVSALFHGVSLGAEGDDDATATIQLNDDYSLTITSGLTDYGQGSRTIYSMIAAQELGVELGRVKMFRPDTNTAYDSGPTVASRATVLGGNATRVAAGNVAQMLDMAAADLLHCAPSQLIRDGESYVGPQEEPVAWEKVVDHAREMGLTLSAITKWESPKIDWDHHGGTGTPYFAYHFAAQVIEVEVDTGTGKTDVVGIWAAHDAGKVLFPQGAYGQIYGGIAQGLGYALTEEVEFDDSYIQVSNFDEYIIPTAVDIPDIEAFFVETHNSAGPYGAKNIAEPALVPTAAATANAIAHATGRRIRDLPANLERVLLGHELRKGVGNATCRIGLET